jgi:hypothetical protein
MSGKTFITTSRASVREIDRSQYADAVEKITSAIMKTHNSTARGDQRAHFGTIKRQWGYNHTNLTGLEK